MIAGKIRGQLQTNRRTRGRIGVGERFTCFAIAPSKKLDRGRKYACLKDVLGGNSKRPLGGTERVWEKPTNQGQGLGGNTDIAAGK